MANERRLIDANALLEKLHRMIDYCESDRKVDGLTALFQVGDAVMDCPTVDAIIPVRCKDCKWFAPNNDGSWVGCQMYNAIRIVPEDAPGPDDYCSYGEAKSGTQPQREDV